MSPTDSAGFCLRRSSDPASRRPCSRSRRRSGGKPRALPTAHVAPSRCAPVRLARTADVLLGGLGRLARCSPVSGCDSMAPSPVPRSLAAIDLEIARPRVRLAIRPLASQEFRCSNLIAGAGVPRRPSVAYPSPRRRALDAAGYTCRARRPAIRTRRGCRLSSGSLAMLPSSS